MAESDKDIELQQYTKRNSEELEVGPAARDHTDIGCYPATSSGTWKIVAALVIVIAIGLLIALIVVAVNSIPLLTEVKDNDTSSSSGQKGDLPTEKPTDHDKSKYGTPSTPLFVSPSSSISQSTLAKLPTIAAGTRTITSSALPSSGVQASGSAAKLSSTHSSLMKDVYSRQSTTQGVIRSTQHQTQTVLPIATPTVPPPTEEPATVELDGSSLNVSIPSGSFETLQFNVTKRSTLELELEYAADETQQLAIYGRSGARPTLTQYDFTRALNSDDSSVRKRAALDQNTRTFEVSEVVEPGHWFLSIFNGGNKRADLQFSATQTAPPLLCPNNCNGRGVCFNGTCICLPKWKGTDCGEENCVSAGCNGHGVCSDGRCQCDQGWKGVDCSQPDCVVPDCSGHGQCVNGTCVCDSGWKGAACDTVRRSCPGDCSNRGTCNDDTGMCTCEPMITGSSCNMALCTDDCNNRGDCNNGTCACDEPWTGPTCDTIVCAKGCETHGTCDNGTCNCDMGWRGVDCLTDACPNNCHGTGSCRKDDNGEWHCACVPGFRGSGCDIGVELICDDGLDNDADFLFDCDDPDCCNTTVCQNDESCTSAPDPTELVANITSNTTVSFFETIQFLFDNNLQTGVDVDFIDRARVAVVKGRVTTRDTTPLIGVTVAVLNGPAYGHTLTRQDSSYDIAVNGGSAVTIMYNRRNFIGSQRSVVVPVNNYVTIEDIAMIPVDAKSTEVDLMQGNDIKVAEGSRVVDDSGSRQGILMFPPNTEATIVTVNGTQNQTVERPVIRVTEYTVGSRGEEAMPAELPPFTGYTYAVEMSVDQATVNGSTEVVFNQTLPYYVENYLGFPVGSAVPTGYYNRTLGEWVPSRNGRVVLVLNITITSDGKKLAVLDVTGDGVPATSGELDDLGVTDQELEQVGSRYNLNQSLWRVPIRHFTPWDCNWPFGVPPGGCTASQCNPDDPIGSPKPDEEQDDDCDQNDIVPQNQAQKQQLEIDGSGLSLFYFSNRALGYRPAINIPVTAANLPESLLGVHLRVEVQGRSIKEIFPPQPNLNYRFAWDRRDSYGRIIMGQVEAVVNIGYEYGLVYYPVRSEFIQSFNRLSDATVSTQVSRSSRQAIFWEKRTVPLGGSSGPEDAAGLGGWSLSIHHSYDPPTGVLRTGTGRKTGFRDKSKIVQTIAGTGTKRPQECPECMKSQKATSASLLVPVAIAVAADGSLFIGDFQLIRRFYPNGNISTVVDFGLGWRRPLHAYYLAVSPVDGDLFISYGTTHQVYRISSTLLLPGQPPVNYWNIISGRVAGATVFAGTGQQCHGWEKSCGDGDLAVNARLSEPKGIGVGARGTVYFTDGKVIRQVGIDGLITTFAGSRFQKGCSPPGCTRDASRDVPLDQAYFGWPTDIAVKLDDESLYVIDKKRLVHITRDGQVRTVAGISPHIPPKLKSSTSEDATESQFVPVPAVGADLKSLRGLVVTSDGSVFFGETDGGRVNRIRILDQSGKLVTFAGSDPGCNCAVSSCKPKCFAGEGQAALIATFYVPSALGLSPEGDTLYIADQGNARIRSVRVSLPKLSEGFYTIPSVDGKEAYQFDFSGRHVSTLLTSTAQVIYTFDYSEFETSSGPKGLLVGITDAYNNTLVIERSSNGQPLALRSPFGITTTLDNDINGHLKRFRDPTGRTTEFTYGTTGLMESMKEPDGLMHSFRYDQDGRLASDRRPNGGSTSLSFEKTRGGKKISLRSNSGRMKAIETSSIASEQVVTVTEPTGAQTVTRETSDGVRRTAYADGTSSQLKTAPHPIWGQELPVLSRSTVKLPSGKSREMTTRYFANLEDDSNPLSATSFGHVLQVDNSDWINVEYTRATNTKRIKNLKSNVETEITYNKYGEEIERVTTGTGLDPIRTQIGPRGLVTSVSQGQLAFNFTYDFEGRLTSEGVGSKRTVLYGYPYDGSQPSNMTLPSGRTYQFSYDAYDNLASITMPSGSVHRLSTTVTVGKTTEAYMAPGQSFSFARDYNSDGDLRLTRYPSGIRAIQQETDPDGRPIRTAYEDTTIDYQYSDNTDRVARIVRNKRFADSGITIDPAPSPDSEDDLSILVVEEVPDSSTIEYEYDGTFVTRQSTEASNSYGNSLQAVFDYQYDSNMLPTKTTLTTDQGHTASISVGLDSAYRISTFADCNVDYSRLGTVSVTCTSGSGRLETQYDGSGQITERSLTVNGKNALTMRLSYDENSLIVSRQLEFGSNPTVASSYEYEYDADGQLTSVFINGSRKEQYKYDRNGNRISWMIGSTSHSAAYDERDQLTTVDSGTYDIDIDGFLSVRGDEIYNYSSRGELLSVTRRSSGDLIYSYVYDGLGRRVMRTDASGTTDIYLYGELANPQRVTHIVKDNELVTLYYDIKGLLFAMDKGGKRYYVATDHLGTPLALIDGTTGQISKQVEYTAYGNVMSDSNPHLSMELGFAGGLVDPGISLVHFMFRDYDPVAGRWTARDPILYTSLQPNLYQYSFNDPINLIDPLGLFCIGGSVYAKFGGGGQFCIDRSGVSACVEAGVGVGASAGVDLLGKPSRAGHKASIFGEVGGSRNFGGTEVGGAIKAEYELTTPGKCEKRWDVGIEGTIDTPYGTVHGGYGVNSGPSVQVSHGGGGVEKWGIGWQAKAGGKYCYGKAFKK